MAKKSLESNSPKEEMTLEEARAFRASRVNPVAKQELSLQEKREAFRIFWAQEKNKYSKSKDIEHILWLHLVASKFDAPEQFEQGIEHFGLKKLGN